MTNMLYLAKFSEIFLHGIRRKMLLHKLIERVKEAYPSSEVEHVEARILIKGVKDRGEGLAHTFGIHSYVKAKELETLNTAELTSLLDPNKTYHVRVKKANTHSIKEKSLELMQRIAEELEKAGYRMGVKKADDTLMIELRQDRIFAYLLSEEKKGPAGFPYASYGKGLILFSGGFDSPVASWLAARKGLALDFLMVSPSKAVLEESYTIYKTLVEKWCIKSRFYYVDGKPIIKAIKSRVDKGLRQIVLKKAIYYLGAKFARSSAIITGDSLNQTSTQRQLLLYKIYHSLDGLFLRPLIGMSKEEIIELSKKVGTYELSSKQKEFCSIDSVVKEEASLEEISKAFASIRPLLKETKRVLYDEDR